MHTIRASILLLVLAMVVLFTACSNQSRGTAPQPELPVTEDNEQNTQQSNEEEKAPDNGNHDLEEGVPVDEQTDEEQIDPVITLLESLTTEQKIGQLVLAGLEGLEMGSDAQRLIDRHIGGFIIFGRNVGDDVQLAQLLRDLYVYNEQQSVPLFLSVDEEGGRVSRFPEGVTRLPSARKIGQAEDPLLAGEVAYLAGQQLYELGYRMNFSPVLDVDSNPNNPIIGDRAYGTTAESVMQSGLPVMHGYRDAGIIPVVKHFPGHGDTDVDSHIGLPVVDDELSQLEAVAFAPFRQAVEEKVEAIMVGHLRVDAIDNQRPASLSPLVMEDLLRQEWGYEGVIITDDLAEMKAIVAEQSTAEAAWQAIQAGADIAMVGHGLARAEETLDRLMQAYTNGELSDARLDASVERILRLKLTYKLDESPAEYDPQFMQQLGKELADRLSQNAK